MEQLFKDIKYYLDLRVKRLKLGMVEHTSRVLARMISYMILIILVGMALLLFSGALTVLVYQWLGSLLYAFLITGGFVALAAFIVYLLRNRLFTGIMVRSFSRMMFKERYDDGEDNDYEDD